MNETVSETRPAATASSSDLPAREIASPTDRPIPLWPEGALVLAAGITLLVIGLRHRVWIQKKVTETQRMVEEFQRHGGMDDLTQVAKQATDLVKGALG